MRRSFRVLGATAVVVGFAATSTGAVAAPTSTTFQVTGVEIAATSMVGTFVGKGRGDGENSAWKAVVEHTPLGPQSPTITGGSFRMATLGPSLRADFVVGTFMGGTIEVMSPGLGCTNQTFLVSGILGNVATSTTIDGSGAFNVLLTHFRAFLFGRCITFAATAVGDASFDY